MTEKQFIEVGNYITLLSSRVTTYYPERRIIENSLFEYIRLVGSSCCLKLKADASTGVPHFKTLEEIKTYINSFKLNGVKRL
jgi:hypothetical protein